ncbi:MAG: hypothetical protein AAFX80_00010 [Cyanobacteria bacterium J06639_18]
MTKQKDGSEQVRIKTDCAEYIRSESERLGKPFLQTLYWIVDQYRFSQQGISVAPINLTTNTPESTQPNTVQANQEPKEELDLDLADFS